MLHTCVTPSALETKSQDDVHDHSYNNTGIHFYSKHKYRHFWRHTYDFDNGDAFIYKDKYTALLQQELQNPYWCLHDPITTKSYQISADMNIETMPHTIYPLTPVQTALQQLSEKHPYFEIQPGNTIRPLEIKYTQTSQTLVPTDTPYQLLESIYHNNQT